MNQAEIRREKIVTLINSEGKVKVSVLSKMFETSEVTIRADLEILENMGTLSRIHGGAVARNKLYLDMDLNERYNTNAQNKKILAAKIADYIEDNDTILLNAGTTLLYVLRAIKNKTNINILTNSIANASEASSYRGFNVTLLGGSIDSKYSFTYGADPIAQLSRYHATKCILSVDWITAQSGLSLYYSSEADLVKMMIDSADCVFVAADSSKFGRDTFARVSSLEKVDTIFTNQTVYMAEFAKIKSLGVKIVEG